MNYARGTNRIFSTKKDVIMKKAISPEVSSRREFIAAHTFIVDVDASTKEANIRIESKNAK